MPDDKLQHQLEVMQAIFGIISRRDLTIDQQIEEILKAGCVLFGEQIGIVSRIEGDVYTVEHVYAPGFDIHNGQVFPLGETFCSVTIRSDQPVGVTDVMNSDFNGHPCTKLGIESYIGMTITVDGEKYGTLNFSSTVLKDHPFLDIDLDFISTLAGWTGNVIGYARLLESLDTRAHQDPLTGLSNRTTFLDRLERCVERQGADKTYLFAVLFVDLDRFKQVNDRLGHRVGDALLKQVAERLEKVVRPRDSLGRYGGDEFLLILEDVSAEQAHATARRIEEILGTEYGIGEHSIDIGASVGVAFSEGTGSTQDLIDRADSRMYERKRQKIVNE
jgi:diguanylate cyclase (GGDEF)-like protein